MVDQMPFERPLKTFTEHDILKDSDVWNWGLYLQINRINFLSSTIWDSHVKAENSLLNMISSVDQLEFLCFDKIKYKKEEYLKRKPLLFHSLEFGANSVKMENLLRGDPMKQLQLKAMVTRWLECFDPYLGSMKKLKRTSFIAGLGEAKGAGGEEENEEER